MITETKENYNYPTLLGSKTFRAESLGCHSWMLYESFNPDIKKYESFCLGRTGIFTPKDTCEARQDAKQASLQADVQEVTAEAELSQAFSDYLKGLTSGGQQRSMGIGTMIGIAVGGVVVIGGLAYFLTRKRK